MKTPEELSEEYVQLLSYGRGMESYFKTAYIAGYKAALDQFRDSTKMVGEPTLPDIPSQFAGSCGKCGAPYTSFTGPWMSVTPPPIQPSCNCWNRTVITTTTTTK